MPEETVTTTTPPPPAATVIAPVPVTDGKPDGWDKLIREGDPKGAAEVGYDLKRHKNYHVNRAGEIIFHEAPAGFRFQNGELVPEETK